jgi:hypothetical protein
VARLGGPPRSERGGNPAKPTFLPGVDCGSQKGVSSVGTEEGDDLRLDTESRSGGGA